MNILENGRQTDTCLNKNRCLSLLFPIILSESCGEEYDEEEKIVETEEVEPESKSIKPEKLILKRNWRKQRDCPEKKNWNGLKRYEILF